MENEALYFSQGMDNFTAKVNLEVQWADEQ